MSKIQCDVNTNSPVWSTWNTVKWKLPEKIGGGFAYLSKFKDEWVRHNRSSINSASVDQGFPAILLAGICWNEVAGDPEFIDTAAHLFRSLDWSGPKIIDRHLTLTKAPELTSFGPVSMQLRVAAETLGLDINTMSVTDRQKLGNCLQVDVFNITTAAKHLRALINYDGLQKFPPSLSDDHLKIAATRYNRGTGEPLETLKKHLGYGEVILKRKERLSVLLAG